MYSRGFTKFQITVACGLKLYWYLWTLSLKFQKTMTKIKVFLYQPCWLSQFSWDSQQGRDRKTLNWVLAFWNFKLKVLKYQCNFRPHATVIPNLVKPLENIHVGAFWLILINVADKYLVIKYMSRLNLYYLMSNFLTSHEWCNSTCEC